MMPENRPMTLFSSNLNHPLNQLSFENQKFMLALTISQFREIPLCSGGYDEEGLRFYDGVLGNLIRARDEFLKTGIYSILDGYAEFASHWEYHGDIYRVLDKAYVYPKNGEPYLRMPIIKWHGMVASWSSSYDFTTGFNHIYSDALYTIIRANTGNSVGVDVNKLTSYLNGYNLYTKDEEEVIFPMKKEFVVKVYKHITPNEFKELMESEEK